MSKNYNNTLQLNNNELQSILDEINNLPEANSGVDTNDATATASDILSGKTAYVKGEKVTGEINTVTQATPSITVSSSGLITVSVTQPTGYTSGGTKSNTKQLSTKGATTYTPSTSNQYIYSGRYITGTQTIKGDSNLVSGNIKKGVSIFGVSGTYEGSGGSSGGTSNFDPVMVTVQADEAICMLGVQLIDGVPAPVCIEETYGPHSWTTFSGSVLILACPSFMTSLELANATLLSEGAYDIITDYTRNCTLGGGGNFPLVYLIRIDAQNGDGAMIYVAEG